MVYRESKPSAALGARPSTVEKAITRAGSNSNQNSTPVYPLVDSGKATPSIVQKANAILNDELNTRAGRSAEEIGKAPRSEPPGLEPTIEGFYKQAPRLGDTLIAGLEHRMDQPAQIASQLASMGGVSLDDDFPGLSFLKPPPPVSPGKAGQVLLTLINDDLKETVECTLKSTDLVGGPGDRIPAEQIQVYPNPVKIAPGETRDVRIDIQVPNGTPPGSYAGLLQGDDVSPLQVLQLSVGP